MQRRKTLTEHQVQRLPRTAKRYTIPDPVQPGLILRVPALRGPIAYVAVARRKKPLDNGRQIWRTVGNSSYLTLDEARSLARDIIRRIRLGLEVDEKPKESVTTVAEKWLRLVVQKEGHRTAKESARVVRKYLLPRIGDRVFTAVGRSDLANVLDDVVEKHGAAQADHVLRRFATIANWWETRDDGYKSPIARGMRRSKTVRRERILTDDELRALWHTADSAGTAGAFVQFAILSGQRYAKVASLRWDDVSDGVWTIRKAPREKNTPAALKLPRLAVSVIERQPCIVGNPTVFGPLRHAVFARLRKQCGVPDLTIHDLRRTCRSLLSRAGVAGEVGERILGHVVGNAVQQTYDRYRFEDEMGVALERLANLVERVVTPPADNVVALGAVS
jgi:integrase